MAIKNWELVESFEKGLRANTIAEKKSTVEKQVECWKLTFGLTHKALKGCIIKVYLRGTPKYRKYAEHATHVILEHDGKGFKVVKCERGWLNPTQWSIEVISRISQEMIDSATGSLARF